MVEIGSKYNKTDVFILTSINVYIKQKNENLGK